MLFIKYVLRIPLRMTEEELLIGDDAIHGEEAYSFYDDVAGLVPTQSVEQRALERMANIHHDDYKGAVLEGQPLPGNSSGRNGSSTPVRKEEGNEVKID
jgi:ammonium transporter, Amt family